MGTIAHHRKKSQRQTRRKPSFDFETYTYFPRHYKTRPLFTTVVKTFSTKSFFATSVLVITSVGTLRNKPLFVTSVPVITSVGTFKTIFLFITSVYVTSVPITFAENPFTTSSDIYI